MPVLNRWIKVTPALSRLVIWGASDQCRINYPILQQLGCSVEGLIDDTENKLSPFNGITIYHAERGLDDFLLGSTPADLGFIVAIGNPYGEARLKKHMFMLKRGLRPVSFADPTALICQSVLFSDGLQVMPAAIVQNNVRIGLQCIVNTRALVEHDCVLEDGVEIGPGAVLCGRVHVGSYTWIGANATVLPRVHIGPNTIIGAGSVVVENIPGDSVAFGVPARVIRRNSRYE
jgi:sugar O-acyltransferase (sialic acid O-acetyltransferase NeuD family)